MPLYDFSYVGHACHFELQLSTTPLYDFSYDENETIVVQHPAIATPVWFGCTISLTLVNATISSKLVIFAVNCF